MYDPIWWQADQRDVDPDWVPSDPEEETEDMDYPVDSTNPFAEVLHIELSIEPYFEVTVDLRAAA